MASIFYKELKREIALIGRTYLKFTPRPNGDYTKRQLSSAAAYTLFCHAEMEHFFEQWALRFVTHSREQWQAKKVTRQLVHMCTFGDTRNELTGVPSKDIWSEVIVKSLMRQKDIISANHGIKEANVCKLLAPLGFDVRKIDAVLLADLDAFASIRGDYAHGSHGAIVRASFDPFSRKQKAESIVAALQSLDVMLTEFFDAPHLH